MRQQKVPQSSHNKQYEKVKKTKKLYKSCTIINNKKSLLATWGKFWFTIHFQILYIFADISSGLSCWTIWHMKWFICLSPLFVDKWHSSIAMNVVSCVSQYVKKISDVLPEGRKKTYFIMVCTFCNGNIYFFQSGKSI